MHALTVCVFRGLAAQAVRDVVEFVGQVPLLTSLVLLRSEKR
jgi:hypothetical protein